MGGEIQDNEVRTVLVADQRRRPSATGILAAAALLCGGALHGEPLDSPELINGRCTEVSADELPMRSVPDVAYFAEKRFPSGYHRSNVQHSGHTRTAHKPVKSEVTRQVSKEVAYQFAAGFIRENYGRQPRKVRRALQRERAKVLSKSYRNDKQKRGEEKCEPVSNS